MRAALFVNTRARHGQAVRERARTALQAQGVTLEHVFASTDPAELPRRVRAAINDGIQLIIVGGGDGTISSIARCFVGTEAVLGILPLGTGNSFARSLELPLDLKATARVIAHGQTKPVSLGKLNRDGYFTNVASIGISSIVARRISRQTKHFFGRIGYGLVGMSTFWRGEPHEFSLVCNGTRKTVFTRQLIIANGRYHAGGIVSPDQRLNKNALSIFTFGEQTRWQFFKTWVAFLFGKQRLIPESNFIRAHSITVKTKPPLDIDLDGELRGKTPATFSIVPDALHVRVGPVPREN